MSEHPKEGDIITNLPEKQETPGLSAHGLMGYGGDDYSPRHQYDLSGTLLPSEGKQNRMSDSDE
jgi:hypothetical protein